MLSCFDHLCCCFQLLLRLCQSPLRCRQSLLRYCQSLLQIPRLPPFMLEEEEKAAFVRQGLLRKICHAAEHVRPLARSAPLEDAARGSAQRPNLVL